MPRIRWEREDWYFAAMIGGWSLVTITDTVLERNPVNATLLLAFLAVFLYQWLAGRRGWWPWTV